MVQWLAKGILTLEKGTQMNGYFALYGQRTLEIHAETSYKAWQEAVKRFKVKPKQAHMVTVTLCEKDGEQVVHTAVD